MDFAENNKISHRQLYRQIILAFLTPFLLCVYRTDMALGVSGLTGMVISGILLTFYGIFLARLTPCMEDLVKTAGSLPGRVLGLFWLSYPVLTGAFLLHLMEKIVPESLISGLPGHMISLIAVLVCAMGAHRGMQRRGRIAEVAGGLFLGGIFLMLAACIFQGKITYLREMLDQERTLKGLLRNTYDILAVFSGISLLPLSLEYTERRKSVAMPIGLAVMTIAGAVLGFGLVMPAVFGWKRLLSEEYPVLPLLAGADLPGKVLARFDVLWLGLILFGLLFSVGSVLFYGHLVLVKSHLMPGRYWLPIFIWILSFLSIKGIRIEDYYVWYLKMIFLPGSVVFQILLLLLKRKKWRARAALAGSVVGILSFCLLLGGCVGIEPEKRMYPLALGINVGENGAFVVNYGMPDQPQAEGQGKSEEGNRILTFSGQSFEEIQNKYRETQEKYLDLGHVQLLILGKRLQRSPKWEQALSFLKEEKLLGENLYVFSASNVGKVTGWQGDQGTSAGEYVQGLMENHPDKQQIHVPTLREVYYEKYENHKLPKIPELQIVEEGIQIVTERR